jgi:hypothetical protein
MIVASVSTLDHAIGRATSQNAARPTAGISPSVAPVSIIIVAQLAGIMLELTANAIASLLRISDLLYGLRQRPRHDLRLAGVEHLTPLCPGGDGIRQPEQSTD